MRPLRAVMLGIGLCSALIPGILTWFVLCLEYSSGDVCASRLMSLSMSLSSEYPAQRDVPHLSRSGHEGALDSGVADDRGRYSNLSFVPDRDIISADVLIAVVSDWPSFTGGLGKASREGWASYIQKRKRHKYYVVFFVGQCPGLEPSKLQTLMVKVDS